MGTVRNVLFIMCDQLRADYLSCYGHPTLQTPNIDALAAKGVRFGRAYTPAPCCGPARMSFYTGRSTFSHGATWNFLPLSIREQTLGDLLAPHGVTVALDGKTHFAPDRAAMERLGIDPSQAVGRDIVNGGFKIVDHYEGHANPGPDHPYSKYLSRMSYAGADPWNDYVLSAEGPDGKLLSGWHLRNVNLPARVKEPHSETAYTTDHAIDFIKAQGGNRWLLHLSYIKPHWPYFAPKPYHDLYGIEDCVPVVRSEAELENANPVYRAFTQHEDSRTFHRMETIDRVRPVYMGLVKQIDDHLGRLFKVLAETGRMDDTLILFTSDHGDYLGDHWLDEKDQFHEPSARIPLIVYDPDARADATRGTVEDRFAEGIDFAPTFLEALGAPVPNHLMEGTSLLPLTRGTAPTEWRDMAVSEIDYAFKGARVALGQDKRKCRGYMLRGERWKYVYWEGQKPQLFDLDDDPYELSDLGAAAGYEKIRAEFDSRLFEWIRNRKLAVTTRDEDIQVARDGLEKKAGIMIGYW